MTEAINPPPMVASFLRAFDLNNRHKDDSPDSADAQFAWAAYRGATARTEECGISSPDHAALAAILAFGGLQEIREGALTVTKDGVGIIRVDDDLQEYLVRAQRALEGIYRYLKLYRGVTSLDAVAREMGVPD